MRPLSYVINKIINTGIVSNALKLPPLNQYIKSDRVQAENYRQITLITNFLKVFEKIMKMKLTSFIQKYHIISKRQYGFHERMLTDDALKFVIKIIYEAVDKRKTAIGVFLDLAKDFDTLDPEILY